MRIQKYTAEIAFSDFVGDDKTYDAVERCLERISEASKKIGDVVRIFARAFPGGSYVDSGISCGTNMTELARIASG